LSTTGDARPDPQGHEWKKAAIGQYALAGARRRCDQALLKQAQESPRTGTTVVKDGAAFRETTTGVHRSTRARSRKLLVPPQRQRFVTKSKSTSVWLPNRWPTGIKRATMSWWPAKTAVSAAYADVRQGLVAFPARMGRARESSRRSDPINALQAHGRLRSHTSRSSRRADINAPHGQLRRGHARHMNGRRTSQCLQHRHFDNKSRWTP